MAATKKKVKYDTGSVPESWKGDPSQAVVFRSTKKNLKVFVYKPSREGEGYDPVPVSFHGEEFRTSNQDLIESLRESRLYGGSKANKYADAKPGESLYYEGDFPEWYLKKRMEDAQTIVGSEGIYES